MQDVEQGVGQDVAMERTGRPGNLVLAARALRQWDRRQVLAALVAAVAVGVLVGVVTVLIPNPFFARDIPPVWWNHPVWIATSILSGLLIGTYVRPAGAEGMDAEGPPEVDADERRSGRMGMIGGFLAWFAVGCPVCNKIALLALGYTGALTWFAPLQPVLAFAALMLCGVALVLRLRGQVACPVPTAETVECP